MLKKVFKVSISFFCVLGFYQIINSQELKINMDGKHRKNHLSYNKILIFPKGQITEFGFSAIDTATFKYKYTPIKNEHIAKLLLSELEKGKISNIDEPVSGNISFTLKYSNKEKISFLVAKNYILIWHKDTTIIVKNVDAFITKSRKITDDFIQDVSELKNIDRIVLTYKKNRKVIDSPQEIAAILECFKEAEFSGAAGCPFYNGRIKMYTEGKQITASLAHDACPLIIINKNYFELNRQRHKKLVLILKKYVDFKAGP